MGFSVAFLTPLGVLLCLGVLVPLVALAFVRRRARAVRRVLGLAAVPRREISVPLAALVAAGALLGLAASQPIVEQTREFTVRTDAEAFIVVDTSRSMLARRSAGGATRMTRAKTAAAELRAALEGVPVGIASLTDRVLPHLFPSPDEDVFQATLDRSIGVERPPPSGTFRKLATELDSLAGVRTLRFFSPAVRHRLLVVLTDGETTPVNRVRLSTIMRQDPPIETVFVQVWHGDERVYTRGVAESYRPDPDAPAELDSVAEAIDGNAFSEGEIGAAGRVAAGLVGEGPTIVEGKRRGEIALAPYLSVAAFLPLALLLWRRDR